MWGIAQTVIINSDLLMATPGLGLKYYGLLASATRTATIARIRDLLAQRAPDLETQEPAEPAPLTLREPCPCCGGPMRIVEIFRLGQKPMSRAPPREHAA